MSRMVHIGSIRDPKPDPLGLHELDIDELVERLTPGEIQRLLDECDPDDPHIPPSMRTNYKCEKQPTGPFDKKKLLDFINEQALSTPDLPEAVPFVPGTVRGKKWMPPPRPEPATSSKDDEKVELDIEGMEGDVEVALNAASTDEIVDLAGILGLHSMMNQDQFHSSQTDKWAPRADPHIGWNGITKATPLKEYPAEEPNRTNPDEVVSQLRENDKSAEKVNLNNIPIPEALLVELFDALRTNAATTELLMSNCTMGDGGAAALAAALENNSTLEKLSIESNRVSPHALIRVFEALAVQQTLKEIKASNQQAQFLGNKVEMAITKAVENNKAILKVGLHFEFGDCRNRVAVQLQKNLDRVRLKRVAHKLSTGTAPTAGAAANGSSSGSRTGGFVGGLPGQISHLRQKSPEDEEEEEEEEEEN